MAASSKSLWKSGSAFIHLGRYAIYVIFYILLELFPISFSEVPSRDWAWAIQLETKPNIDFSSLITAIIALSGVVTVEVPCNQGWSDDFFSFYVRGLVSIVNVESMYVQCFCNCILYYCGKGRAEL